MSGILYKAIEDIADIEDLSFLQGARRCGHVRWFVTNHYKARTISSSTNNEYFHNQVDITSNPFQYINLMGPHDRHSSQTWESKKEMRVQYFNNYLVERFRYQYYTHP